MNKKKSFTLGKDRATQFQLHTLMLPGTICIILFSILPLFGLILAFKNYSVVEGVAGIFTDQLNLYSFYGSDPSVPYKTFGYYMFFQTNKYVNDMSHYPVLSAFGLIMTAVAVPLTFLTKRLLEKFGPSVD